jgi:glycosyltransferase involved in cell wall biosynthesis
MGKRDRLGGLPARALNIGLIVYGSLENLSGGYLYDRKLVEYLRRQGDRVELIAQPWRSYAGRLAENFNSNTLRQVEVLRPDILLQDELNHPSLSWLNRRLQTGWTGEQKPLTVAIVHHLRTSEQRPAWQNRLYAIPERSYLKSVDGFIFNSQTTADSVLQPGVLRPRSERQGDSKSSLSAVEGGSSETPGFLRPSQEHMENDELSNQHHIPSVIAYPAGDRFRPQIDETEIAARAHNPGPLHLVFLGNLIERKGLHNLLEALASLPPGTAELEVIGSPAPEPAYARRIQARASRPDLAGRVRFTGALDDEALASRLRRAQLLVVPSSYEGYGIAYLEGMSFGLPAIAGNLGAAWEIITPGKNGFLVAPGDRAGLAEQIASLGADRGRLQAMSLAARQRFLAQPSWDQTAQVIREFLLKLLAERPHPA